MVQRPACALANFYPRPPRGGRHVRPLRPGCRFHFYPRPPRGGRPSSGERQRNTSPFLSTPSARRATAAVDVIGRIDIISIHALREEGDSPPPSSLLPIAPFLSTPSARRATASARFRSAMTVFLSTPSARRATGVRCCNTRPRCYFYPRPPRGGRPARSGKSRLTSR